MGKLANIVGAVQGGPQDARTAEASRPSQAEPRGGRLSRIMAAQQGQGPGNVFPAPLPPTDPASQRAERKSRVMNAYTTFGLVKSAEKAAVEGALAKTYDGHAPDQAAEAKGLLHQVMTQLRESGQMAAAERTGAPPPEIPATTGTGEQQHLEQPGLVRRFLESGGRVLGGVAEIGFDPKAAVQAEHAKLADEDPRMAKLKAQADAGDPLARVLLAQITAGRVAGAPLAAAFDSQKPLIGEVFQQKAEDAADDVRPSEENTAAWNAARAGWLGATRILGASIANQPLLAPWAAIATGNPNIGRESVEGIFNIEPPSPDDSPTRTVELGPVRITPQQANAAGTALWFAADPLPTGLRVGGRLAKPLLKGSAQVAAKVAKPVLNSKVAAPAVNLGKQIAKETSEFVRGAPAMIEHAGETAGKAGLTPDVAATTRAYGHLAPAQNIALEEVAAVVKQAGKVGPAEFDDFWRALELKGPRADLAYQKLSPGAREAADAYRALASKHGLSAQDTMDLLLREGYASHGVSKEALEFLKNHPVNVPPVGAASLVPKPGGHFKGRDLPSLLTEEAKAPEVRKLEALQAQATDAAKAQAAWEAERAKAGILTGEAAKKAAQPVVRRPVPATAPVPSSAPSVGEEAASSVPASSAPQQLRKVREFVPPPELANGVAHSPKVTLPKPVASAALKSSHQALAKALREATKPVVTDAATDRLANALRATIENPQAAAAVAKAPGPKFAAKLAEAEKAAAGKAKTPIVSIPEVNARIAQAGDSEVAAGLRKKFGVPEPGQPLSAERPVAKVFEDNPAKNAASRFVPSAQENVWAEFVDKHVRPFTRVVPKGERVPDGFVAIQAPGKTTVLDKVLGKQVPAGATVTMPRELHRLLMKDLAPAEQGVVRKALGKGADVWKWMVTVGGGPAYHVRNLAYSEVKGIEEFGAPLWLSAQKEAATVMASRSGPLYEAASKAGSVGGTGAAVGKKIQDIRLEAGLDKGFLQKQAEKLVGEEAAKKGAQGVRAVVRAPGKAAEASDAMARLTAAIAQMKRGASMQDALDFADQFITHTRNLSPLEAAVAKVAPFAPWTMRELPGAVAHIASGKATIPVKLNALAEAFNDAPPEKFTGRRLREQMALPTGMVDDQGRPLMLPQPWSAQAVVQPLDPLYRLAQWAAGNESGAAVAKSAGNEAAKLLAPQFSMAAQAATGQRSLTKRPLDTYGKASAVEEWLADNLPSLAGHVVRVPNGAGGFDYKSPGHASMLFGAVPYAAWARLANADTPVEKARAVAILLGFGLSPNDEQLEKWLAAQRLQEEIDKATVSRKALTPVR